MPSAAVEVVGWLNNGRMCECVVMVGLVLVKWEGLGAAAAGS